MIIEHNVIGNESTTFHDFMIEVVGQKIIISPGVYIRANQELYKSSETITIDIDEVGEYLIWITTEGIKVYDDIFKLLDEWDIAIDRLIWFNYSGGSLEDVEINFMKIVSQ